jgi:hypothetical protein
MSIPNSIESFWSPLKRGVIGTFTTSPSSIYPFISTSFRYVSTIEITTRWHSLRDAVSSAVDLKALFSQAADQQEIEAAIAYERENARK